MDAPDKTKLLNDMLDNTYWPYNSMFDQMNLLASPKPTRWQWFTYYAWRKWWYAAKEWLHNKVCNCEDY